MHLELLKMQWLQEERAAHIHGWDFSHIEGRYEEGLDIPWNFEAIIRQYLSPNHKLLDMDTGGGEFLLRLNHPHSNTSATEGYPPNIALCRSILLPLGIDFWESQDAGHLPFSDCSFDIVINRHGDFDVGELFRILKPGGIFMTQQVGAENDRELVELLLPTTEIPYPEQYLKKVRKKFLERGFQILHSKEAFSKIKFYDVGALVWFARIIEWEFPGFSVESCFDNLCKAQQMLDEKGSLEASTHRYLLVALKPVENEVKQDICW